jgi:hypothetical protein
VRELFRKHGIVYEVSKQVKSDLFRDLLPLFNSRRITLPRNQRLVAQIISLERKVSPVGKETISHPNHTGDDLINAVAGAAFLARKGSYDSSLQWVDGGEDPVRAWDRLCLQTYINSGGRIRLR